MKYTVHLYKAVRITLEDIEADSQQEAALLAWLNAHANGKA
jgi:hypothetical protein